MDMFAEMKGLVLSAIERLVAAGTLPRGLDLGAVTVEPPRDPAHGDMATNAAMVLSRPARKGPREIAEALAAAPVSYTHLDVYKRQGLAILRRIVESAGGYAWLEEAAGGGCSVLIELPAGDVAPTAPHATLEARP